MSQPETPLDQLNETYLSLKVGAANKNSARSHGKVHYRILADHALEQLFITIVGNGDGGCFSKEVLPFNKIELCLQGIDTRKPIASKLFHTAFTGRSANNPGFLTAVLRDLQLLTQAPDVVHQHCVQPDWEAWKTAMLALAPNAEHYKPEPKQLISPKTTGKEKKHENNQSIVQETPKPPVGTDIPAEAESVTNESTDRIDTELTDDEMDLLQRCSLGAENIHQQDDDEVEPAGAIATVLNKQSKKQRSEKRPHPTEQDSRHVSAN